MSEHPHTRTQTDEEDPYESLMARQGAPKHRFPARESDPRLAYALVHDELLLDGVARMNLATFCTTWAEPEVLALLAESLRQEHRRQGRVPPDRGARDPLRADARRPVALARTRAPRSAPRPRAPARRRCWRAWRRSSAGASAARPKASRPTSPTSCAARCRCAGRSSRATSTWRSARCRWTRAAT